MVTSVKQAIMVHEDLKAGDFAAMQEKDINGITFSGLVRLSLEDLQALKKSLDEQTTARLAYISEIEKEIAKRKIIKV